MAPLQTKEEKERFFAELDNLGQSDDETIEVTEAADLAIVSNPPLRLKMPQRNQTDVGDRRQASDSRQSRARREPACWTSKPAAPGLRPSLTAPAALLSTSSGSASQPINLDTQPSGPQIHQRGARKQALPKTGADVVQQTKTIRSKSSKIKTVPSEEQRFRGLTFFFIPNNDISKPRKMRIQLSIAHGAAWARDYGKHVTHIIVDKEISWIEAAKGFDDKTIPDGAPLVKDTWLSECIEWKCRWSPLESRFRLEGAPPVPIVQSGTKQAAASTMTRRRSHSSHSPVGMDDACAAPLKSRKRLRQQERDHVGKVVDHDAASETESVASLPSEVAETVHDSQEGNHGEDEDELCREALKYQDSFSCMRKNDGTKDNPNARTIAVLQEMSEYYDRTGDNWRTLAYRKAIGALRKQPALVSTKEEAAKIPQIGIQLAEKIEEIVLTNRLRKLDETTGTLEDQALHLFTNIYGVGPKQASQWIAQGHRTLDDVRRRVTLSRVQKIGVDHYEHFLQRIPRAEVRRHAEIVEQRLKATDPGLEGIVGGSYRRGAQDSGDIDIIITKKDAGMEHIRTLVVGSVVPQLWADGFLKAALATGQHGDDMSSKWHGASCLPDSSTWRRIDLLFVPWAELGAALIYFTGNDIFNRSMRLLASKNHMRLNQRGLYKDVMRGEGRTRLTDGTLVESHDEKKIFDILGVHWRPPEHRQC